MRPVDGRPYGQPVHDWDIWLGVFRGVAFESEEVAVVLPSSSGPDEILIRQ